VDLQRLPDGPYMELAVGRPPEIKTGQRKTMLPTNRGAFSRVMTKFSRNPKGHHD